MQQQAPFRAEVPVQDLDRDFDAFARTGDPAALGRVYDGTAAELLALATRLVGDPVEAEDMVQATFVAAIESASTFAAGRRVMPWLVGILTNRVRRHRRARGAGPAAADPASLVATAGAPADAAQRAELDAALARALEGLSPVLHAVVVLHLRHGMQPAEIAFALGRPPATVRSQLARGLQRVRERLPGGALLPAWLAVPSLRGLDAVRVAVLQHAAASGAAAAATAVAIGGLTMAKHKLALGAVLVLALGAGALWWQSDAAATPSAAIGAPPGTVATAASPVESERRGAGAASAEVAVETRGEDPDRQLASHPSTAVRVTVRLGERPLRGAVVELFERGKLGSRRLRATTGDDGTVQFAEPPPWGYAMLVGTQVIESWRAVRGEVVDVGLEAPPPCWVHGRVYAESPIALSDTRVFVGDGPVAALGAVDVLTPLGDGSFELPIWSHCLVGVRAARAVPVHRELEFNAGAAIDVEFRLRTGAAALRGRVVDSAGAPVAGAGIEVGDRLGRYTGRLRSDESRESVVPVAAVADTGGGFAVDGLCPGPTTVHVVAPGFAPGTAPVVLRAGDEANVIVALATGARIHGRVRRTDGTAAKGAAVRCGPVGAFDALQAWCDGDGRFEFAHVPSGRAQLFAEEPGQGDAQLFVELAPGDDRECELVVERATIAGTLVDERGAPLAGWFVLLHQSGNVYDTGVPVRVGSDGGFTFSYLQRTAPPGELRVHPPGELGSDGRPVTQALLVQRARPGERDVRLVVPDRAMPSAGVHGRIADDGSRRIVVYLRGDAGTVRLLQSDADGAFAFEALTPGRWQLMRLTYPTHTTLREFELRAGEVLDLGVLSVPTTPHVAVEVELVGMPACPDYAPEFQGAAALQVLTPAHEFLCWQTLTGERTVLNLLPGRYSLRLCGAPMWAPEQTVDVVAGEPIAIRFEPRPAALRRVAFRHPQSGQPFEPLALEVRDAGGALLWNSEVPPQEGWWHAELNLPPGAFRLRAHTRSGLRCDVPLPIDGVAPAARPLLVDLLPD